MRLFACSGSGRYQGRERYAVPLFDRRRCHGLLEVGGSGRADTQFHRPAAEGALKLQGEAAVNR
ncbi:hypothetical protein METUNv1_01197 [Methyloversatilis universalis FAM5]|uniref:Uncharacterized protein n=1 Tax=Methyloversatilis universalis (strain ATCC BAA-1314 / DSM 25237 / JCM 13912 / CCUG 52030 / FAM5) TaxID=1000565 RepID=F5RAI3_METUF|nr:hypothetical protein METUNv1_01197 [Methyloversatilis universalis FAM5]